ncbi:MAG: polysaccharide biosynthesis C-terminal domain-containing protein [Rhodospirillaceae bacterium]|nr:polysaccharide biosynthesis C-terminal domain-containing protein [Rhodospirillaceae bacterium]
MDNGAAAWVQATMRAPLTRNGYSLVASAGVTSALGLVYWVVAARLYTPAEVGVNAALLSTMMALGNVAQLNLGSLLTRFLPDTGPASGQWILRAYAAATAAAILSCLLFVLGVERWAPSLRFLAEDPWMILWFTAATAIWTLFSLQDNVLAGLRRSVWVPVENTVFALAKLGLLLLFAEGAWRALGPFASWTLPLLATAVPVNLLIFGRLLKCAGTGARPARPSISRRLVARYFGGDFVGTLFLSAAMGVAPVLVLEWAGAEANALYYMAWTIAYTLYLVSKYMGVALLAEGAADRENLRALATGALAHTMGLLAVGVAILLAGAPLILRLFGASYAAEGVTLLRVLALSALPFGFTSVFLGVARVEGRMTAVAVVQGLLLVLVVALGVPLLARFGVLGMGVAWLLAQTAIALLVAVLVVNRTGVRRILGFRPWTPRAPAERSAMAAQTRRAAWTPATIRPGGAGGTSGRGAEEG